MGTLKYRFKTTILSWHEMKKDGEIAWTQSGRDYFFKNVPVGNGCSLRLEASNYCGKGYITAETSVPKFLYGTNVETATANDLEYLNDSLTDLVNRHTRIPFEANEAEITRLDVAHNFQTGGESYAHAYRDAMKEVHIGKRLTQWISAKEFDADTVYWSNKSQEILVYPKFAETKKLFDDEKASVRHLAKARGMLRLEHRLLTAKVVSRELEKFGYANRADIVVPHILELTQTTLEKDMKTLGLDRPIEITGELERLNKLQKACGDNTEKLQSLLAFLTSCDLVGESNVVGMGLIKQKTFDKRKGELKRMGISLAKPKRGYVLPPLPVPSYDNAEKSFNKKDFSSTRRISTAYKDDSAVYVEGVF